jgi:hypothetical protein
MPTPIALFTYNRPYHTTQMLASLAACDRLDECEVFIYCDGVGKSEHAANVKATREVVREWVEHHPATTVERSENLGLAASIIQSVTELCQRFGRVIVVEDDLILAKSFLDYQLRALDHYAEDERVFQVVGFMFPVEDNPDPQVCLLPITSTWGWGTWKRAWDKLETNIETALATLTPPNAHSFDVNGAYPYTQMLKAHQQRGNSWGVMFWYSVWRQGGLGVFSRQSLVANIGMDGSGVNSGVSDKKAFAPMLGTIPSPIDFPNMIDERLWKLYQDEMRRQRPSAPPLWRKLLARLTR